MGNERMRANAMASIMVALSLLLVASGSVAGEDGSDDRLRRIEDRLDRIEKLLERLAGESTESREKVLKDKELVSAIKRVEEKYGLADIVDTLCGRKRQAGTTGYSVWNLGNQLLKLLYEEDEKKKPDPDLMRILSSLLRMRGSNLASILHAYKTQAKLLLDPDHQNPFGMWGGRSGKKVPRVHGELGKALAGLLLECLEHPGLERYAAAEAHFFPRSIIEPALARLLRDIPPESSARRRRLLAAHAACGNEAAMKEITREIQSARDDAKWLQPLGTRYAGSGMSFGLLALVKVAERELRAQETSTKSTNYYPRGATQQVLQLIGRANAYGTKTAEIAQDLTDEERKDPSVYQERYREAMLEVLNDALKWVRKNQKKLVWDESNGVYMAR